MNQTEQTKYCSICEEDKPHIYFSPLKTTKDGLHSHCKACRSLRATDAYHKRKDLAMLRAIGILPLLALLIAPWALLGLLVFEASLAAKDSPVDVHISPLSFTFHPRANAAAKKTFPNSINGSGTTYHLGVHTKIDYGRSSTALWVFQDSFGKLAGGGMQGFNYRFLNYFSIGAMGGIYIRQKIPNEVKDFPVSVSIKDIEVLPIGGITGGVTVPVTKKVGVSTNCVVTVLVNNCSMGLRLRF